jgi:hypothetical protein
MRTLANVRYRHFKGGLYEVMFVAKDSTTLKEVVIYRCVKTDVIWTRDRVEFESFLNRDGVSFRRFEPVVMGECPKCKGITEQWHQEGRPTPAIRCLKNGCTWPIKEV